MKKVQKSGLPFVVQIIYKLQALKNEHHNLWHSFSKNCQIFVLDFWTSLDSILFDEKNKEFTICDGSLGTYKFCDVVRSQIVYEHARYKGKSPLFSHRVLISTFNTSIFIELKKVYVGVEIELSNKGKAYVYISKNPVIQHNLQFEEDYKIAKQIDKKLKRMSLEKNRLD